MKRVAIILLAVLLALSVCSGALAEETYTLRLGNVVATNHVEHEACLEFEKYVEEHSDGRIQVEVYPTNQTGDQAEQLEGIRLGTQEALLGGVAVVANYYPKMYVLEIPYLFTSNDQYLAYLASDAGVEMMNNMIDYAGVRCLGFAPREARQTTTNKPIHSIADMAGLKIRVPSSASLVAFWEAVGAAPVTMAFNDVYQSLATGVIEAQENPLDMIYASQFYEVQKYVIMTNHTLNMSLLVISEPFYQSLPDDLKAVLDEAGQVMQQFVIETNAKNTAGYIDKLKAEGMEFIDVDVDEYKAASANLYKDFVDQGYFTEEDYQSIVDFIANFEG